MNKQETQKILMLLNGAYPNMKVPDRAMMVEVWWNVLSDIGYDNVTKAIYKYMRGDTSNFPPSIGQIVNLCKEDENPTIPEAQAWSMVHKALRNSNYNAESEFEKLPKEIQDAVGSPAELRRMAGNEEFNEGVESSNFKRVYRTICDRRKFELKSDNVAIGSKKEEVKQITQS